MKVPNRFHTLRILPISNEIVAEMVAIMEYVWEQIDNNNILKGNHVTKQTVQTALRVFTCKDLDLKSKHYHLNRKRVNIIRNL